MLHQYYNGIRNCFFFCFFFCNINFRFSQTNNFLKSFNSVFIHVLVVTTNPLCNSRNILHNASCNFDKGPCGFTIPLYPHLWDITRYDYGNKMAGLINGDHTSGKFLMPITRKKNCVIKKSVIGHMQTGNSQINSHITRS